MSTNIGPEWVSPETLGEIYGAAVSMDHWPTVLDRCCNHVGSRSASLMTLDTHHPAAYSINALSRIYREADQSLVTYFLENLAELDAPGQHYSMQHPSKKAYKDTDVWPDEKRLDEREDSVWLRKHFGVRRRIAMRLNDNPRYLENIAFQFPSAVQSAPAEAFSKAHGLASHLAKSLEMSILYSRLQRHYAAVLGALDKVGVGMCIVEASGSVIIANSETLRIIENGQGLKKSATGQITCHNDNDSSELKSMILAASLAQTNYVPRAESILAIRRNNSDELLLIEVSPLRDHNDELNTGHDTVLLQIVDTDCSKHCDTSAFSIAYQLSDAESAIVPHLLNGLTNREISDERGTSPDTIKSQVAALMRKAHVDSRVQLVRRILKTEPPVAIDT